VFIRRFDRAEDPYTPKGRWEEHGNIKEYIFDKPKKSK